jgi:hypothetical protein
MKGPLKKIPDNLVNEFTMNDKISIFYNYFDESKFIYMEHTWDLKYIAKFLFNYTKEKIENNKYQLKEIWPNGGEPYPDHRIGGACKLIQNVLNKYKVNDKSIAIIGSTSPWIESILVNNNAKKVTTVEYNIPKCNFYKFNFMRYYEDFKNSKEKFDIIISYSSIEHSGLGRYGDILDPDGDKKTLDDIYENLGDDGFLFLGIPIGNDALVWNANRIYGSTRLPYLLENFEIIEWFGTTLEEALKLPKGFNWKSCYQPIIVLKKRLI